MRKLDVKTEDKGGTLLFSDSPEYVKDNGILYTEVVEGDVRLLFYHLNDSGFNKKLAVLVENVSNEPNTLEITRGVMNEPSTDFLKVGKEVQTMYMEQKEFHNVRHMRENDIRLLSEDISNKTIMPGQLVYGIYDFHAEHKVKVTVIMYPEAQDPIEFLKWLKVLPKDEHSLRGTFDKMDRTITMEKTYDPSKDGIVYIMLADNVNDLFKTGIDSTDGSITKNFGNYGINYTINLKTTRKRKTRIFLTPLGGSYAGAMKVNYEGNSHLILVPEDKVFFGDKTPREPEEVKKAREEGLSLLTNHAEIAELGTYSGKVSFEYSPPGASNLPVHLILMPADDNQTTDNEITAAVEEH